MKMVRVDGHTERSILIAMITSTAVLARLVSRFEQGMLGSQWGNQIAHWCIDHYRRYKKAPGHTIQDYFQHWAERQGEETVVEQVGEFISGLNEEYVRSEEINVEYILDIAGKVFNENKINTLRLDLGSDLESGLITEATQRINEFRKVELGMGAGVDVFSSPEVWQQAMEAKTKNKPMILYPGVVGEFIGRSMERDSFISFIAPSKRGKSFNLVDAVWRAIRLKRRVAYFVVGDMSQDQVMQRLMSRATNHPILPETILFPVELDMMPGDRVASVRHEKVVYDKPLNWQKAFNTCSEWLKNSKIDYAPLRLSVHPGLSVTVLDIRTMIEEWRMNYGWCPDVIVIDYADVLAPVNPRIDYRHQINDTWARLSALRQEYHCCLVTATQTNREGFESVMLKAANTSEDKRKLDHVTGMIGINVTDEEKSLGLSRWNWLVGRETKFSESQCVYLAGTLGCSNPAMLSCWES
jgi:hypothetical protein